MAAFVILIVLALKTWTSEAIKGLVRKSYSLTCLVMFNFLPIILFVFILLSRAEWIEIWVHSKNRVLVGPKKKKKKTSFINLNSYQHPLDLR